MSEPETTLRIAFKCHAVGGSGCAGDFEPTPGADVIDEGWMYVDIDLDFVRMALERYRGRAGFALAGEVLPFLEALMIKMIPALRDRFKGASR